MLGKGVGVKRILPGQVLGMNKGLGARDSRSKLSGSFAHFTLAVVGVAGCGKISLRQVGALRPVATRNARA
jgi:hypothetical protein